MPGRQQILTIIYSVAEEGRLTFALLEKRSDKARFDRQQRLRNVYRLLLLADQQRDCFRLESLYEGITMKRCHCELRRRMLSSCDVEESY